MRKPRVLLDADGVLIDFLGGVREALLNLSHRYEMDARACEALGSSASVNHDQLHHEAQNLLATLGTKWDFLHGIDPVLERHLNQAITSAGFVRTLKPCNGAFQLVAELREAADELYVVTAPWEGSDHWMIEREEYLKSKFGFTHHDIIFCSRKEIIEGDLLVDDKPKNCRDWAQAHSKGAAVLWGDEEYTRHLDPARMPVNVHRTASVKTVLDLLESVKR